MKLFRTLGGTLFPEHQVARFTVDSDVCSPEALPAYTVRYALILWVGNVGYPVAHSEKKKDAGVWLREIRSRVVVEI